MKITIAGSRGVLLPDPDGEIQDFLDRHQSLEDLCPFGEPSYFCDSRQNASDATAGVQTGLGRPNSAWHPERWKLNSIYWPVTGACRYGVGIFLVNDKLADKIKTYSGAVPVKCGDIQVSLFPLPLRKIGTKNLWLFVGVDARYKWQFKDPDDFTLTYASTWASLFSTLETALGITFDPVIDVDAAYSTPNFVEFQRQHQNAAAMLDAAAASVGQRVVTQLNGKTTVQKSAASKAVIAARAASPWKNLAAGGVDKPNIQAIPYKVEVIFPRYQSGAPQANGDVWNVLDTTTAASLFAKPGTLDGIKIFNSTADAEFASDPAAVTPDNETAINALALQITTDYLGWLMLDTYDYAISGIDVFDLCGSDDWLLYELGNRIDAAPTPQQENDTDGDEPEEIDEGFVVQTRLVSLPVNYGVENLLHAFATRRYAPVGMVRVELTASLAKGGSATANLLYYSAGLVADSRAVKVYDHMGGFSGVSGDRFWATGPMRDSNHFEIVAQVCN